MGFSNLRVFVLVMLESCLIATHRGFGGLAVTWLITVGGSPVPSMLLIFIIPPSDLIIGAFVAVLLGIVAGAIPAFQAMQLKISEALRRSG